MIKDEILAVNEEFFVIRDELKCQFKVLKRDRVDLVQEFRTLKKKCLIVEITQSQISRDQINYKEIAHAVKDMFSEVKKKVKVMESSKQFEDSYF